MFHPPASAHGGRARAVGAQIAAMSGDLAETRRIGRRGEVSPAPAHKILCTKNPRPENTGRGRRGTAPARKTGGNEAQNPLKCHQKAPALTRGGQKEGFPVPTASRLAGNGLSKVVTLSVRPVGVRSSRAGDVVQIMPPAVRANVVNFARAAHPAHVKFAIRGAFVRQNHQSELVHAGKARRRRRARMCRPVALLVRHRHPPPPSRMVMI